MEHDKAVNYAGKVSEALKLAKLDDELYVSVIIKENGQRHIIVRPKNELH